MPSRRDLFVRVVLPHLLVVPLVVAYVHRDASRRGHPAPWRVALTHGSLGVPGLLLYRRQVTSGAPPDSTEP